ncbi:hypothetical protein [Leifsonia sp. NPDC058248]|uniref:hypothetical protein n=1 Tax=Leifsonia sp. NPDC058248 TaxID=3346402 RepID=UPI0036D87F81
MTKKIDSALKELLKALKKHGEIAGAHRVSVKQLQRANARLTLAAAAYVEAVYARTGQPSPFAELVDPGLDEDTIRSLKIERDSARKRHIAPLT